MPNDLEDFLKRAAQLRQQRAAEQRALANEEKERRNRSRRREYTDSRREREVNLEQAHYEDPWDIDDQRDDPIMIAEVVDDSSSSKTSTGSREDSWRDEPMEKPEQQMPVSSDARQVLELLTRPGGIRQAFLMREILNRRDF